MKMELDNTTLYLIEGKRFGILHEIYPAGVTFVEFMYEGEANRALNEMLTKNLTSMQIYIKYMTTSAALISISKSRIDEKVTPYIKKPFETSLSISFSD